MAQLLKNLFKISESPICQANRLAYAGNTYSIALISSIDFDIIRL